MKPVERFQRSADHMTESGPRLTSSAARFRNNLLTRLKLSVKSSRLVCASTAIHPLIDDHQTIHVAGRPRPLTDDVITDDTPQPKIRRLDGAANYVVPSSRRDDTADVPKFAPPAERERDSVTDACRQRRFCRRRHNLLSTVENCCDATCVRPDKTRQNRIRRRHASPTTHDQAVRKTAETRRDDWSAVSMTSPHDMQTVGECRMTSHKTPHFAPISSRDNIKGAQHETQFIFLLCAVMYKLIVLFAMA